MLRPPRIIGKTPTEQIAELQSYLRQLIPELQYIINTLEKENRALSKRVEELKKEIENV